MLCLACSVSDEGRAPPAANFFYPTGVVADPSGDTLFVTNGNTDLRYNGGSIVVINFARAMANYKSCSLRDPIDPRIPVCNDSDYIDGGRTLRIGSFAGQPVVQRFRSIEVNAQGARVGVLRGTGAACDPDPNPPARPDPNCVPRTAPDPRKGFRLLVPVRGDPSLTWINAGADGSLACGQGPGEVPSCDGTHRLTTDVNDPTVLLPPEPFEVAVSEDLGIAATAHLFAASVALFDVGDSAGFSPVFVDLRNIFDINTSGIRGAYGIAVRPFDSVNVPASCPGFPACSLGDYTQMFVTSRFSPLVGQVIARGADQCRPGLTSDPCSTPRAMNLVPGAQIRIDSFLSDGSDSRDVKFTSDGSRAFVVNQRPPSVLVIDTTSSPAPAGNPRGTILYGVEVCSQPSLLTVREFPPPLRVYVTCFAAGQIFAVDPTQGSVADIIDVGRGPNAVVPVTLGTPPQTVAVVVNFADNDLAVVDIQPGSPGEDTVLFKIGLPRPITTNTTN
jgi:hypothetical protein